jgi:predicted ferric reductase
MDINFNQKDKTIDIKDGLKSQYFMIKALMILNLVNALLNVSYISEDGIGFMQIIWLILGIVSIVVLYFYFFKKSSQEKIEIKTIERLTEKTVFGSKRLSLKLSNGKSRDLAYLKTSEEISKVKKMLSKIGVSV